MSQKLEKAELAALALQSKHSESELTLNQVRRMLQSAQDEKKLLEGKLEIAGKERERQAGFG